MVEGGPYGKPGGFSVSIGGCDFNAEIEDGETVLSWAIFCSSEEGDKTMGEGTMGIVVELSS